MKLSPSDTNGTTIRETSGSDGQWERFFVQSSRSERNVTTRTRRRVVHNGHVKGHLSASYSSESDSEGSIIIDHNRTLSRLSHFSVTDDEACDESAGMGKVKGHLGRGWGALRGVASRLFVWVYWSIVQSFVLEKWILNFRRRERVSPAFVPPHRCHALVRKVTSSPRRWSGSLRVPWKFIGLIAALSALFALFYFTDVGAKVGGGLEGIASMLPWNRPYETVPEIGLDEEPLSAQRLREEEELGKIEEKWVLMERIERLKEEVATLERRRAEEVEVKVQSEISALELEKSSILAAIEQRIGSMEAKWENELKLVAIPIPPVVQKTEAETQGQDEIEVKVLERVRAKLEEMETRWISMTQMSQTSPPQDGVLEALEETIRRRVDEKVEVAERKFLARLDEILREQDVAGKVSVEKVREEVLKDLRPDVYAYASDLVLTKDCLVECPPPPILAGSGGDVDEKIRVAIATYDADKTGRADLALESGGGSIVSTRCTKKSSYMGSQLLIWNIPIWYPSNSPRKIIQPGTMPGDCWSFDGVEGFVVIKLVGPSRVTGFTLEHIPKVLSPHGHIESAPRKFQVVGHMDYSDFENEFVFGDYEYLDNGNPIQYFPVQNTSELFFPYVELKVLSNHGNVIFTCLYRFRVHGHLSPD